MTQTRKSKLNGAGIQLFLLAAVVAFGSVIARVGYAMEQSQEVKSVGGYLPGENDQKATTPVQNKNTPIDGPDSWDRDPEQWAAAVEEFEAITDGTMQIQPEEIGGYSRVLRWVREQPLETLRQRSTGHVLRKDFLHDPASKRGKLYQVELQVCRVLPYTASDSRLGSGQLYEVWGWAPESGAWLYVAVTPDLPPGFPTGATVAESAVLYGYFYKLQGYLEAGAAPRSKPLIAPLFLGKLEWRPKVAPATGTDRIFWMAGISLCVLWFMFRANRSFRRGERPAHRQSAADDREHPLPADQWLQSVRQGSSRPAGEETERI